MAKKKNKVKNKELMKIEDRYEELAEDRQPYLDRGRELSKLALKYVLPEEGETNTDSISGGHQSLTGEAVANLAAKVTLALFPINVPFFSIGIDPDQLSKEEAKDLPKKEATIRPYTNELLRLAMRKFNQIQLRPALTSHARHLITSGNSCIVFLEDEVKQLGLDSYVTKRSNSGKLIEAITKEEISISTLDEDIQKKVRDDRNKKDKEDDEVTVYTQYIRTSKKKFSIVEYVDKVEVARMEDVKEHLLPAVFGIWNYVNGEDYGRGEIEQYAADFVMYEFLCEYRARGAATIMDIKFLVRPGSLTDVETLNNAQSGSYVTGVKDDIVPLVLDRYPDTKFISEIVNEYKERISKAFLMLSGVIRDSERTTAYEIQEVITELESTKSGIYSSQVESLQKPVANNLIDMISPKFRDQPIEVKVDSGLESLGKVNDLTKLRQYTEFLATPATWPEPLQKKLNMDNFSDFIADRLYLDVSTFFISEEDAETKDNQTMDNVATSELISGIASGVGSGLGKNIAEAK